MIETSNSQTDESKKSGAVREKVILKNRFKMRCKTILTAKIPSCKSCLIDIRDTMWQDVPERRNANMEIGKKLKDARLKSGFTQTNVHKNLLSFFEKPIDCHLGG